jgi:preprotein translocase subunit SecF
MVRVGLWGLHKRGTAWAFFWLSLAIAAGCIAFAFATGLSLFLSFVGGTMVLSALWYYLAIRWVDRHSSWS